MNKTGGMAKIWGIDIDKDPRESRAALGVVPQEINMDPFFTPLESLDQMAGFYGVPKSERRSDEILDALGLGDKKDAYVRQLSGGMKRRLMVAKALVHNPPILILDEPTAGVDVELRRSLWEYVRKLNAGGTTIVLTTHYLEEAEEMCDTIAIINQGDVVACEADCNSASTTQLPHAGDLAGRDGGGDSRDAEEPRTRGAQGRRAGDHLPHRRDVDRAVADALPPGRHIHWRPRNRGAGPRGCVRGAYERVSVKKGDT